MANSDQEIPFDSLAAASFAHSLVERFRSQGKNPDDLFVALAGLICGGDSQLGADCLKALDGAIERGASEGTYEPPA
jgi:hypothetical protein